MSDIYTRLVEAGAPHLSEPFFYRIKTDEWSTPIVELRYRNPRIGSSLLGVRRTDPTGDPLAEVVEACQDLVDEYVRAAEAERLGGDHPTRKENNPR